MIGLKVCIVVVLATTLFFLGRLSVQIKMERVANEKHMLASKHQAVKLDPESIALIKENVTSAITEVINHRINRFFDEKKTKSEIDPIAKDSQTRITTPNKINELSLLEARNWLEEKSALGQITLTSIDEFQFLLNGVPPNQQIELMSELHRKIKNKEIIFELNLKMEN